MRQTNTCNFIKKTMAGLPLMAFFTHTVYASEIIVDENPTAMATTVQKHGLFDAFVQNIYNSYLFQKYISTWGAPLNNASFIVALLIVIFFLIAISIVELVLNYRKSKKIAKINEEKLEKRRQQEAEDALLREYMRFKMLAEANGVAEGQGITYEQWLAARVQTGQTEMSSLTPEQQAAVEEAKEVAADTKETITEAVSGIASKIMPKKELSEDEQIDAAIAEREKEEESVRKAEEYQKRQEETLKAMRESNPVPVIVETAKPEEQAEEKPKPASGVSWAANVEAIKQKYNSGVKKTELVDLPDADENVHLSEAAVVKPVTIKEKPKPNIKEENKQEDGKKQLEEKTPEMQDDMGVKVPEKERTQFDELIAALHQQKTAENKAKALSAEAEKAKEQNIELLQTDLENTLEEAEYATTATAKKETKENSNSLCKSPLPAPMLCSRNALASSSLPRTLNA